jgi:aspartyl-tRNA synthetase
MFRTNTCGELNKEFIGKEVTLSGWCDTVRDHGNLTFIDLRDRYGITQVVLDHKKSEAIAKIGKDARKEFVIKVSGTVKQRPEGTVKKDVFTGEIELAVENVEVLSIAKPLPIDLTDRTETNDELLLKYRYLALRKNKAREILFERQKTIKSARDFLIEEGFIEIETPILAKSTPEGARDYLVPSRVNQGKFYALPQSPQIFKQLSMIAGFDKYFQFARCFRDEDLRADRQPEFTQIDMEMSFVEQDDILDVCERMMQRVMKEVKDHDLPVPFPRMTYEEAMGTYGIDKPDTRFELKLIDATELGKGEFNTFNEVIANGGIIRALNVKGQAEVSRKEIAKLEEFVKIYKAKGLANMKFVGGKFEGSIAKFFSEEQLNKLKESSKAEDGDLVLIVADAKKNVVYDSLGNLRNKLGKDLDLIDKTKWNWLWVTDFPMFEWLEDENRLKAMHHPFTSPKKEDMHLIDTEPLKMYSDAYDLVLNGYEITSGSIRIHNSELQAKIFKTLGISDEEAKERFGFFVEAFKYGTPPHGGLAPGLDRLLMLLNGTDDIRDVLAFPKNKAAESPMEESPANVSQKQLDELALMINLPEEEKQ